MPEIKSSTKYAIFSIAICLALAFAVIQAFQYLPDENQNERLNTTINVPGDETIEEAEATEEESEETENKTDENTEEAKADENSDEFDDAQEIELNNNNTSQLK